MGTACMQLQTWPNEIIVRAAAAYICLMDVRVSSIRPDVLFGPLTLTQQQPIDGHLISRS